MMAKKNHALLDRNELAERLESLAARLRAGELEVDGRHLTVPDMVEAKIGCKEKKGRIVFKLRWRWSTLGDYEGGEKEAVVHWQDSMKAVKKRLSTSFKALRRAAEGPEGPGREILDRFIADSRAFAEMGEPEWEDAMQAYADHLDNLSRAVELGQVEAVRHEIRDIGTQMKACHRQFK